MSALISSLPDWNNWYHVKAGHPLFFAALHEVFGERPCVPWLPNSSAVPAGSAAASSGVNVSEDTRCATLPNWRTSKIYVEFSTFDGLQNFFARVLPRLQQLRELYAAARCTFLLTTVLREPTDGTEHLRSTFDVLRRVRRPASWRRTTQHKSGGADRRRSPGGAFWPLSRQRGVGPVWHRSERVPHQLARPTRRHVRPGDPGARIVAAQYDGRRRRA